MKLAYNDAQHAYWLDGKRCKSVTTVAKIPEDTYRLERWQQRQVAIGLATKPTLLEQIAANVGNDGKINDLCDLASAEAGAHEGRDRGNVLHTALEMHDTGKRFIPTDLTSTAIVGWEHILDAMGWTVELVERCVVWPEQLIAGRFDRIVKDRNGERFIIDFKGGAKVASYPHAIACQLALYANAPLLAGPIPGDGGSTEEFTEQVTGDINNHLAYVVHLPPDGDAQLISIDIERAYSVVRNVIFPTIKWRAEKGLAAIIELPGNGSERPVPVPEPSPFDEPGIALSGEEHYIATQDDTIDPFAGLPSAAPAPVLNPHPKASFELTKVSATRVDIPPGERFVTHSVELETRQDNIARRLQRLKDNHREMAQVVASRWPEGVPNIKMPLTSDDLDRIEAIVVEAERAVEAPFDPPLSVPQEQPTNNPALVAEPAAPGYPIGKYVEITWTDEEGDQSAAGVLIAVERNTAILDWGFGVALGAKDCRIVEVDEGPMMDPADIDAMKRELERLERSLYDRIQDWVVQANDAGVPISLRSTPSKRRFSIARMMLLAVHHHEDVVRAVLALAIGDEEIQTVVTTGSVLGVLTQQEAEKAWEILLAVDGGGPWSFDAVTKRLVAA
jgi:hypothetical protein